MTAVTVTMNSALREGFSVFKPRIALFITLSALGGLAVTPGALPEIWRTGALLLAVFLAAGAAGAFNQWAERDLDAQMMRTSRRPFVTGRFSANSTWLVAITLLLLAAVTLAGLATNWWAALYTFLGAFTYGVVYTVWLKRRTWTNIIVGGLAGSFAVLAGAAAVDADIGTSALILTVVLFLWTPPHFWSLAMLARDEYAAAGVPMLPVIAGEKVCAWTILAHTVALFLLSLVPGLYGMGWIYMTGALAGGLFFTWTSIRLVQTPTRSNALKNFFGSLVQLGLLVGGALLERLVGTIA